MLNMEEIATERGLGRPFDALLLLRQTECVHLFQLLQEAQGVASRKINQNKSQSL